MPNIPIGPGQKAVVYVLQRQLFPSDGFVTHKAIVDDGDAVWHADLVQTGQRWTAKTQKELYEKFATELLNKDYLDKKDRPGRPKKDARKTQLNLTIYAREAIAKLAQTLGVDWSTMVSYLALKAYASLTEDFEIVDVPLSKLSDDAALVQTIRQKSFAQPKTAKQIMAEFEANRQEELTEVASLVRAEMHIEEETKKFVTKKVTDELSAEEAAAEKKIQREE